MEELIAHPPLAATDGQPTHTREVTLGCVFTQATYDKEGFPIRDPDSTIYTGAIETAEPRQVPTPVHSGILLLELK